MTHVMTNSPSLWVAKLTPDHNLRAPPHTARQQGCGRRLVVGGVVGVYSHCVRFMVMVMVMVVVIDHISNKIL